MSVKIPLFISMCLLCMTWNPWADIRSTSGNILFDSNNDDQSEALLDSTGLGIGTSTVSANLHVQGNFILESGELYVGGETGDSTLQVQGSLAFGVESLTSGNHLLSGNSMILVDASQGNVELVLPSALETTGRKYVIKRIDSGGNSLSLVGGIIDNATDYWMSSGNSTLPFVHLDSMGSLGWGISSKTSGEFDVVSADNLVSYWTLDEISGTQAADLTGNETLDLINISFSGNGVEGKVGRGILLDGNADYLRRTDQGAGWDFENGGLNAGTSDFTLMFWNRGSSAQVESVGYYISKGGTASATAGYSCYVTSGPHFNFVMSDGSEEFVTNFDATVLIQDDWHHVVCTLERSTTSANVTLYLDGAQKTNNFAEGVIGGNSLTNTGKTFIIGSNTGTLQDYTGELDDIRIYNRALRAEEVKRIYDATK